MKVNWGKGLGLIALAPVCILLLGMTAVGVTAAIVFLTFGIVSLVAK